MSNFDDLKFDPGPECPGCQGLNGPDDCTNSVDCDFEWPARPATRPVTESMQEHRRRAYGQLVGSHGRLKIYGRSDDQTASVLVRDVHGSETGGVEIVCALAGWSGEIFGGAHTHVRLIADSVAHAYREGFEAGQAAPSTPPATEARTK